MITYGLGNVEAVGHTWPLALVDDLLKAAKLYDGVV